MPPDSRPPGLFDRAWEWAELVRFATDARASASLGIVSGRRRQGKSLLLSALVDRLGGLYHEAIEATPAEALRRLGESYREHLGLPVAPAFSTFAEAIEALLALPSDAPVTVVLDELPYLVAAEPSLPSLLATALGPGAARRRSSRVRLLVCGSALSLMGGLLRADAPLRGRAGLELQVRPFGYRDAAAYWGLEAEPSAALRVFAIVGGTPAYRQEFVGGDVPAGLDDVDDWVARAVLNPARPLLREGRVLLAEEPDLRDRALYHTVLGAIAGAERTRARIASRVGRASDALGHPLGVLEEAGLVERREDAFRRGRPTYAVADPYLRFWYAVVRPRLARLRTGADAAREWGAAGRTYATQVLDPTFEELFRTWVQEHATAEEVGGEVVGVGAGTISDPRGRTRHEVDAVGWALRADGGRRIELLGEAKVGQRLGMAALDRLRAIRRVAVAAGHDAGDARLALCSGVGFAPEVHEAQARGEALLVDLARLYGL